MAAYLRRQRAEQAWEFALEACESEESVVQVSGAQHNCNAVSFNAPMNGRSTVPHPRNDTDIERNLHSSNWPEGEDDDEEEDDLRIDAGCATLTFQQLQPNHASSPINGALLHSQHATQANTGEPVGEHLYRSRGTNMQSVAAHSMLRPSVGLADTVDEDAEPLSQREAHAGRTFQQLSPEWIMYWSASSDEKFGIERMHNLLRDVRQLGGTDAHVVRNLLKRHVNTASENVEGSTCSICLQTLRRQESSRKRSALVSLPCAHVHHKMCLLEWLLRKPECPVCRLQLTWHNTL